MPDARNDLARVLADIDQCLARAERIAADPEHEDHEAALDFLIEFQEARRAVEAKMRGPMRFRKLRIAFSITCAIACVLLIGLWVRSYWQVYSLYENHYAPEQSTYVRSWVEVQKGSVVIS